MRVGISLEGNLAKAVIVDKNDNIVKTEKLILEKDLTIDQSVCVMMDKLRIANRDLRLTHLYLVTDFADNALKNLNKLKKVGILRLAGHRPDYVATGLNWDQKVLNTVLAGCEYVDGGFYSYGLKLMELNRKEIEEVSWKLIKDGATLIGVIGLFSHFYPEQENEAISYVPIRPCIGSHEFGYLGFFERENILIFNMSLMDCFRENFGELKKISGCRDIFVSMFDGTMFTLEDSLRLPAKTLNSMHPALSVGACHLAGVSDGVVCLVRDGRIEITVVNSLFPSTLVDNDKIYGAKISFQKLKKKIIEIDGRDIKDVMSELDDTIKHLNTHRKRLTIFTGPEIDKLRTDLLSIDFTVPEHQEFAACYGSVMADIAIRTETRTYIRTERDCSLIGLKEDAIEIAIERGARNPRIVEARIMPFCYLPENLVKVNIIAVGRLDTPSD